MICSAKIDKIASFLLLFFAITEISVNYLSIDENLINLIRVSSGLLCSFYAIKNASSNKKKIIFLYGFLFSILMVISILFNANANYVNILWIWSYIGVALLIYNHNISSTIALIILVVYTVVFSIGSLFNKVEASELFATGSANGVSVLFLFAISVYYLLKYKENSRFISYTPILFLAFLSIWAANRSGLLTAAIMAIGVILNNIVFDTNHRKKTKNIIVLLMVCMFGYYVASTYLGAYSSNMVAKYDRYGNESVRTLIWTEYLIACINDLSYLLFGAPSSDTHIFHYNFYNGNTHNAFFMLHAKFGLLGLLIILFNIIKFFVSRMRRGDFYLIVVMGGIIIRGMFDWTAFPGLHDIFFWIVLMYNKFGDNRVSINNLYKRR